MAVNKFQFKRIGILHEIFIGYDKVLFNDLLTRLNNQLDTDKTISRRTLFLDIALLKELGAPIVKEGKHYTYASGFSLFEVFNPTEAELLREAVGILKRVATFAYVKNLLPEIENLAFKLNAPEAQTPPVIYYEHNPEYQGLDFLPVLYRHVVKQHVLAITYVDFQGNVFHHTLHPYLLKEYNKRWYVFGLEYHQNEIYRFPLDRIRKIEVLQGEITYQPNANWDAETYFSEMVGISRKPNQKPEKITLRALGVTVDYLLTKPLHHSQRLVDETPTHTDFAYWVIRNYEFEALIRSFGDGVVEV